MKPKRFTKNIRKKQDYCEFELKNCSYKDIYGFEKYSELEENVDCELTLAIDKLGYIEDFEDEIGLDLIDYFNLLRCGGYYKIDNKIERGHLYFESDIDMYVLGNYHDYYVIPTAKNRGKEWAMDKEEFEK